MPKILIVYYSRSGNTEKMAQAIAQGAKTVQNVEVDLKNYEAPQKLMDYDVILIGAPTYHHTITNNIKNFLEEVAFQEIHLKDKVGGAFGSYGWSGEAPRLVLEVMEKKFGMDVLKPPLLIKNRPDEQGLEECRKLGHEIAERISKTA